MTIKDDEVPKKQEGIDVEKITFDTEGEAEGLDDDLLDSVAGGLSENTNCPCNAGC